MGAVADAWGDIAFVAVVVVLIAIWIPPRVERRNAKRATQVREAEQVLRRKAVQAARDAEYAAAEDQATLDAAFDLATAQYHAALETGQGGRMPTRQQVAAQLASITYEHDRIEDMTDAELLAFGAIVKPLRQRPRPPVTSERIDTDGTRHIW